MPYNLTRMPPCACGCGQHVKAPGRKVRKGHVDHAAWLALFWSHVDKRDGMGCWRWTGNLHPYGYGMIHRRGHGKRHFFAHRLAYEIYVGPIPEGLFVCHHCDVPACIRPDHLFAGTQADNIHDMIGKGRQVQWDRRGERNGSAKLTVANVLEIRRLVANRAMTRKAIAEQFGVGETSISHITTRHTWKSVA